MMAMHQLPVPEGLADRVLARLGSATHSSEEIAPSYAVAGSEPIVAEHASVWSRLRRRRWVNVAAALAATILVALSVGRWLQTADDSSLEAMTAQWLSQVAADGEQAWQKMGSAPPSLKIPDAIVAVPASWRRLGDGRTMACRIVHPAAGTALLFVARSSAEHLPAEPPAVPQSTTGGQAVGYWQSASTLYVLVVPGNARSYRSFVRAAPSAVAKSDHAPVSRWRLVVRAAG